MLFHQDNLQRIVKILTGHQQREWVIKTSKIPPLLFPAVLEPLDEEKSGRLKKRQCSALKKVHCVEADQELELCQHGNQEYNTEASSKYI